MYMYARYNGDSLTKVTYEGEMYAGTAHCIKAGAKNDWTVRDSSELMGFWGRCATSVCRSGSLVPRDPWPRAMSVIFDVGVACSRCCSIAAFSKVLLASLGHD